MCAGRESQRANDLGCEDRVQWLVQDLYGGGGDLGHIKNSIFFCNKFVINNLCSKEVGTAKAHYSSDRPFSQFKNQSAFTNLPFHQRNHGASAKWNYFATSHGRGKNDRMTKELVTNLDEFIAISKKEVSVIATYP
uniref:Uncharacterized protein n=1 Tax=Octopus bimaculoides TaxID=37653 RepID=A0A0L8GZC3_OCTBM